MLEICNLTKRYNGIPAVQDVSFTIRPGEILGYIGPNGAGKSTTVKMIIGLLEPSEGRILFEGNSVLDDLPAFQSRFGYVPEEPNLYPYLSGWEYLQLAGRLHGLLQGLAAQGRMILYSSHVLEVLEKVCSSVVILRKGRVVAQDSLLHLRELMHQPSLEGIFAQFTRDDDPAALAGRVLQVMKA